MEKPKAAEQDDVANELERLRTENETAEALLKRWVMYYDTKTNSEPMRAANVQ